MAVAGLAIVAALTLPGAVALAQATAPPVEVAAELPAARLQGSGTLRYFGFRVYEARLWSGERAVGGDWSAAPLALELEYRRSLDGAQIAELSLTEMRRQGDIGSADAERWLAAMRGWFPDVRPGDRLTAVLRSDRSVRIFFNGTPRGELRDPVFARLFIGIWLAPSTSQPALRESLLGTAAGGER
ncbi:MAG: chalcone isomerase family protein [Chitinophagaceae bacterium]|nr:chalcone isomerase family protein [Rubrivivax sp.]